MFKMSDESGGENFCRFSEFGQSVLMSFGDPPTQLGWSSHSHSTSVQVSIPSPKFETDAAHMNTSSTI